VSRTLQLFNEEPSMSSLTISNSASTTLPAVSTHNHGHGHKKGILADSLSSTSSSNSTTAQLPVGAAQSLFASLLQSLEQIIGVQPSAATTATTATTATSATGVAGVAGGTSTSTAASPAGGAASATAVSPTLAQDLHGFLRSLFQVLKQEASATRAGTASAGTLAAASSTGVNGAPAVTGAAQYQGSLASSLQGLIQQVGSTTGSSSAAIANLDNSFSNLMSGLTGNTASTASTSLGGATSTQSSNAALQTFLNNLLQNLQANGLQAPKLTGTNVNANA
jgi:hypothetical protein